MIEVYHNISHLLQVVYEPVPFPAVTFCNLNSIMSSKLALGGEELVGVVEGIQAKSGGKTNSSDRRRRRGINHEQGEYIVN